jgi:hypothetical protein
LQLSALFQHLPVAILKATVEGAATKRKKAVHKVA